MIAASGGNVVLSGQVRSWRERDLDPLHRGFDRLRWAAPILYRPLQTYLPTGQNLCAEDLAERIAWATPGVIEVTDRITVVG
jgi:hypothetical protein